MDSTKSLLPNIPTSTLYQSLEKFYNLNNSEAEDSQIQEANRFFTELTEKQLVVTNAFTELVDSFAKINYIKNQKFVSETIHILKLLIHSASIKNEKKFMEKLNLLRSFSSALRERAKILQEKLGKRATTENKYLLEFVEALEKIYRIIETKQLPLWKKEQDDLFNDINQPVIIKKSASTKVSSNPSLSPVPTRPLKERLKSYWQKIKAISHKIIK